MEIFMGVYCYTLRKDTKIVEGLKIARYGYAYKDRFWADGAFNRLTARAHSFAESAQYALKDSVDGVIIGEWEYAKNDKLPIMKVKDLPSCHVDCNSFNRGDYEIIGYLVKVGRKFKIERN